MFPVHRQVITLTQSNEARGCQEGAFTRAYDVLAPIIQIGLGVKETIINQRVSLDFASASAYSFARKSKNFFGATLPSSCDCCDRYRPCLDLRERTAIEAHSTYFHVLRQYFCSWSCRKLNEEEIFNLFDKMCTFLT